MFYFTNLIIFLLSISLRKVQLTKNSHEPGWTEVCKLSQDLKVVNVGYARPDDGKAIGSSLQQQCDPRQTGAVSCARMSLQTSRL